MSSVDLTQNEGWDDLPTLSMSGRPTQFKSDTTNGVRFTLADGVGRKSQYEITVDSTLAGPIPQGIVTAIQGLKTPAEATALLAQIQAQFNKREQHRVAVEAVRTVLPHHTRLYNACPEGTNNVVDEVFEAVTPLIPHARANDNIHRAAQFSTAANTQRNFNTAIALLVLGAYKVDGFVVVPVSQTLFNILVNDLGFSRGHQIHALYNADRANSVLQNRMAKPARLPMSQILRRQDELKRTLWIVDGTGRLSLPANANEARALRNLPVLPYNGPPKGTPATMRYRTTKYG